ncbi:MAG: toll/interleukin-1 receptor domain-containing protein [Pseudomonadota bacterium]
MSGIFISYRRQDSLVWAGRLFDTLRLHFGGRMVFMDINGGIPRGANFERRLAAALEGCDALLALIGPQWLHHAGPDGARRLDQAHDWVRREIAGSLQRNIPVVPVLLGGAQMPAEADLPADLQPLCKQQKAVLADTDWPAVWR